MKRSVMSLCCALAMSFTCNAALAVRTLTLVAEDDWYPYSAQQNGVSEGYAVELVRAAYAAVGVDVRFKVASFKSCMKQVEDGTELGCFDVNQDDDTRKRFIFPKEYLFVDTGGIYDMASSKQPDRITMHDLVGFRVGYTNGAVYGDYLDHAQGIQREFAMSDLSNLRKLIAGRQDYSLISTAVANYLFKTYPDDFAVKPRLVGLVTNQKLYVGFSKKRPEAAEAASLLDEGLAKIRANGIYSKIEIEWLGTFRLPDRLAEPRSKK